MSQSRSRKPHPSTLKSPLGQLRALRFLLRAESDGRLVTPADLGAHLGMKSSSITIMLDRLTASGHVSRRPHPSDRGSITIAATPGADEEVRHTLGQMHERTLAAAAALDDTQADVVGRFLSRLADTLDEA